MIEAKRADRRKLDNAALAFPAVAGKRDSRVFRIYCRLRDAVEPEILQKALERTVIRHPVFQCVLKRGPFWFYLKKSDIHPLVKRETDSPCGPLYRRGRENLLYQVTYRENVINMEAFHALTDGAGAVAFLTDIVSVYLDLKYGMRERAPEPASLMEQEEDSFGRNYDSGKQAAQTRRSSPARQIAGRRLRQADMRIMEYTAPVRQLREKSQEHGCSITVYLASVFLCSIAESMGEAGYGKPIALMVPVNLRKYYDSKSMANFFGWMEIEYCFKPSATFGQVAAHVKERFAQDLKKEQVALRMNRLVRAERNPVLAAVPLGVKNFFLRIGAWFGSRNVTAVFSNLGPVVMPDAYQPYIEGFGVYASTDRLQGCACSYGEKFYFSITTKYADTKIPALVEAFLRRQGIDVSGYRQGMG